MVTDDRPPEALAKLRAVHGGWLDESPFYLMIVLDDERMAEIDLGGRGWLTRYADFLRAPGTWYLVRKDGQLIVIAMLVFEGEQPYYVAKHVGFTSVNTGGPNVETVAYGLGKKRLDGHVDRVWYLSNGCIALGDDIEPLAIRLLKQGNLPS